MNCIFLIILILILINKRENRLEQFSFEACANCMINKPECRNVQEEEIYNSDDTTLYKTCRAECLGSCEACIDDNVLAVYGDECLDTLFNEGGDLNNCPNYTHGNTDLVDKWEESIKSGNYNSKLINCNYS